MRARLLTTLALLVSAGAVRAQVKINDVTSVEVRDEGSRVAIVIQGTRPPNFTTFSMADPPRFVIDLSESRFVGVASDINVEDGLINVIKNLSYGSDLTSIARVMVAFAVEVDPPETPETEGNALIVRFAKPAGTAMVAKAEESDRRAKEEAEAKARAEAEARARAEAEAQARAAEEQARAAEAQARAAEEQARAAEEQRAREERERGLAAAKAREEEDQLRVREDAAKAEAQARAAEEQRAREERERGLADAKAREEEDRRRQAEDARLAREQAAADRRAEAERQAQERADAKARAEEERRQQAEEARLAREQAAADRRAEAERRAAEIADAKARAAEERRARAEEARLAREQAAADRRAEAERKRQEAAEAKARAKEERLARLEQARLEREAARAAAAERLTAGAPVARLKEIGFKNMPGTSRVFVRTDVTPRFTVQDVGEDVVRVEFENTRVARRNDTRFMDTSFFPSAVALITPSKQGDSYVVEIKLKQRVPYQQRLEGDVVALDFERPAASAPTGAEPAGAEPPADVPAVDSADDEPLK